MEDACSLTTHPPAEQNAWMKCPKPSAALRAHAHPDRRTCFKKPHKIREGCEHGARQAKCAELDSPFRIPVSPRLCNGSPTRPQPRQSIKKILRGVPQAPRRLLYISLDMRPARMLAPPQTAEHLETEKTAAVEVKTASEKVLRAQARLTGCPFVCCTPGFPPPPTWPLC